MTRAFSRLNDRTETLKIKLHRNNIFRNLPVSSDGTINTHTLGHPNETSTEMRTRVTKEVDKYFVDHKRRLEKLGRKG